MGMPELNKYAASYKKALSADRMTRPSSFYRNVLFGLSLYDQAASAFSQAIAQDFDNSELYFYEAICILKGKKAFKALRPDIDKIEELLAAAISIEPRGIYYYLHAYIKHDYYERKRFKSTPSCQDLVEQAVSAGFHSNDAEQLFQILKVEIPSEMILSS